MYKWRKKTRFPYPVACARRVSARHPVDSEPALGIVSRLRKLYPVRTNRGCRKQVLHAAVLRSTEIVARIDLAIVRSPALQAATDLERCAVEEPGELSVLVATDAKLVVDRVVQQLIIRPIVRLPCTGASNVRR